MREVRRKEKIVGRGRWERIRDWISGGREKKSVPSWRADGFEGQGRYVAS